MHVIRGGSTRAMATLCALLLPIGVPAAFAQGQDSTPGQRNLLIMAEMLPGTYDNINQNYSTLAASCPMRTATRASAR